MTRINAGSTLVNQYAPPFVVSDYVAQGWELQWNETLLAFEAIDPSANVVEGGFSSIEYSVFQATRQQTYVVPWAANSKQSLVITIDGVKQNQTAYTVNEINTGSNTTTITLDEPLTDLGDFPIAPTVEILGLQSEGGAQVLVYLESTSDDTQVLFPEPANSTIGWYPPNRESLIITIDGTKVPVNEYFVVPNSNFTGAQIQFISPPYISGAAVDIEILGITTTGETIASPVDVVNLGTGGTELFKEKTISGEQQILNFRSLVAGSNITLAPAGSDTLVEISASEPAFTANITVAGGSGIAVVDTGVDPTTVKFRGIVGGDGINVSSNATDVTIDKSGTYGSYSAATPTILATDRVIGITDVGAKAVVLPNISNFYNGETITVKREDGNTGTITISITGGSSIDGAGTYQIVSPYGYVTLYSNGTQFLIVSTSE